MFWQIHQNVSCPALFTLKSTFSLPGLLVQLEMDTKLPRVCFFFLNTKCNTLDASSNCSSTPKLDVLFWQVNWALDILSLEKSVNAPRALWSSGGKRLKKCQSIQPAFGLWSGSPWTPSRCWEGYSCWRSLGWCWIWFKCTDHSLSMPILAVLKMKLASRMMVNINYRCLCLHLTTFSSWQFLWSSHGLIVSTFIYFFFF